MSPDDLVSLTERYVREQMLKESGILRIAHDFKHIERVRNRALFIAREECFMDIEAITLAALLHDSGLGQIQYPQQRGEHGRLGARLAADFLHKNSSFNSRRIEWISAAISYHCLLPDEREKQMAASKDDRRLSEILCDADMLDALGALGLIRAITSKYYLPEYLPPNIRGDNWGLSTRDFQAKTGRQKSGVDTSNRSIIDQINEQIRYHDSLYTVTARKLASPLLDYMKGFILQMEQEVFSQTQQR